MKGQVHSRKSGVNRSLQYGLCPQVREQGRGEAVASSSLTSAAQLAVLHTSPSPWLA